MKKRVSGDFSILIIFLFIGIIILLSITLYIDIQNKPKQDESISQLELDITKVQIKNTELTTELEKNNDMIDQTQNVLKKIKIENMELITQKEQYEKQIENLDKNPKPFYERGKVRFAVIADIHSGGPQGSDRPAVKEIVEWDPDFIIIAGDMVYGHGDDENEWNIFWDDTMKPILNANIPIYPVIGNHDGSFPLNPDSDMPFWIDFPWAVDIGKGWYSFIIDNIEIVVVENNHEHVWSCESIYTIYKEFTQYNNNFIQEQRIDTESALSTSPHWLFLVSHKGAYWNATYVDSMFDLDETDYSDTMFNLDDEDYKCNQKIFDEWLDKYSIDMFISGHIHMGDTYLQNGSIYSHVPPANYFHPVETPHQRGQFAMYDIFPPDNLYPEGSLKIKHINFEGKVMYSNTFSKNPDFIDEDNE